MRGSGGEYRPHACAVRSAISQAAAPTGFSRPRHSVRDTIRRESVVPPRGPSVPVASKGSRDQCPSWNQREQELPLRGAGGNGEHKELIA